MANDKDIRREQLKAVLERAEIEIRQSVDRLDQMGDFELAEFRGVASSLVAFFDKNGVCASQSLGRFDPVAFFDKNGTCGSHELRTFDPVAFFDKNGTCGSAADDRISRLSGRESSR